MPLITSSVNSTSAKATPFYLLGEDILIQILAWRNNDEIRRWMENNDIITLSSHLDFAEKLADRNDCIYLLVEYEDTPIGVINLINIDAGEKSAELGVYRRPDMNGKGLGDILIRMIEKTAEKLHLEKLFLKVKKGNTAASSLYKRNDFIEYAEDDVYKYMEKIIE